MYCSYTRTFQTNNNISSWTITIVYHPALPICQLYHNFNIYLYFSVTYYKKYEVELNQSSVAFHTCVDGWELVMGTGGGKTTNMPISPRPRLLNINYC